MQQMMCEKQFCVIDHNTVIMTQNMDICLENDRYNIICKSKDVQKKVISN